MKTNITPKWIGKKPLTCILFSETRTNIWPAPRLPVFQFPNSYCCAVAFIWLSSVTEKITKSSDLQLRNWIKPASTNKALAAAFVYNETFCWIAARRPGNKMAAYGQVRERSAECTASLFMSMAALPPPEPMSTLKGHFVSCRRPGAIRTAQYNLINSPKGLPPICAALGEMKCSGLRAAPSCRMAEQKEQNKKIQGCQVSVLHH